MSSLNSTSPSSRKRRMQDDTKDKQSSINKHTKVKRSVSMFNSLPIEIIKKIFRHLLCYDLIEVNHVCRIWNRSITELLDTKLDVKKVKIDHDRKDDVETLFSAKEKYEDLCTFDLHKAPYKMNDMIDKVLVTILLDYDSIVDHCELTTYGEIVKTLKEIANNYAASPKDSLRKAILSLTGLEDQGKQLKEQGFNGEFAKTSLSKYEWYKLRSGNTHEGVAVLYPDKQTISIFTYPEDPDWFVGYGDSSQDSNYIDRDSVYGNNDHSYDEINNFTLYDMMYW